MPPVPPAKPDLPQPKYVDSLWCIYAVSVVAAWNAEFLTYPLDLIKTRLQIQGELNKNGGKIPYRGMLGTAAGITREEGVHRLWQGIHAAFCRHLIYSGTRIMTYKALKEKLFKQTANEEYFPLWKSAICGVSAGALAQYIASPTDLVKVQLQMEGKRRLMGLPSRVNGLFDAFQKVWATGGVRGLWKGSVPNVQRAALVNLGDLTTYDFLKRFILRHTDLPDNHLVHVMASCGAGFVAAAMGTPADVIKTRVMNQPLDDRGRGLIYTSSIDCLRKTVHSEGLAALYKGFVPIWMRMAPWSLSFWLTYEEILSTMGARACFIVLIIFLKIESIVASDMNSNQKVLDPLDEPQSSLGSKIKKTLLKRFHIFQWLPSYTRGDIIADLIAGLTVGLTMIPQSVAYAGLAGLKPQYGLYTAFIGSFTYIFVGTIKEVSIGPTSLMALLTFSYTKGQPIECVILLTFLAGCIELAMGLFKLGFLVDFISPCLTSGFTSATSIIIIVSQLKGFLGISIKHHSTFPAIQEIASKIGDIRFADTFLGVCCVIILLSFKLLAKIKVNSLTAKKTLWLLSISKNALVVFLTSLMAFIWYNLQGATPFKLTGPVPSGLPDFGPPSISVEFNNATMTLTDMITSIGSGIIVVPLVAVLANVAIAKAYSSETVVDASQEMISLGLCNIFGSFVRAMPSCGAFTRSSVASSSNVRTPLQGVYSGTVIILALSFLAPYFFYIPKATLAAVLIVAAYSLVDYEIFVTLWKCNKIDFFMTLLTFSFGVVFSVELSIVIGAIFNALILLKSWSRPRITIETQLNSNNLQYYLYIKPELGLFYPAADYITECIKKAHRKNPSLPIAIDCANILQVDYSATKSFELLAKTYNKKPTGIVFLNVHDRVLEALSTILNQSVLVLCQSEGEITPKTFSIRDMENLEEAPLMKNGLDERRFSEKKEDVRKGSLCSVE